jgi:bifunctional non-homologous end joining protein LigD
MEDPIQKLIRKGERSFMPRAVKPMLSTLIKEPFNDAAYVHEIKWDGYRLIAYVEREKAKVESRGGLDYTRRYPLIIKALTTLTYEMVLDGEAVALNSEGKPDFDSLQKYNGSSKPIIYYVFDILWLSGYNVMKLPLLERKEILRLAISDNPIIRYSDHFEDGLELFEQVKAIGLEGIVSKQKSSPYLPGHRGKKWYKIPTEVRQEFVIGGWVESESRAFRTLMFGAYENKKLIWLGHASGGFKEKDMSNILEKLRLLEISKSPFANKVEYEGKPHWVKPELVANIKYAAFTRSGKIRKPAIFQGFREDKKHQQVVKEIARNYRKNVEE